MKKWVLCVVVLVILSGIAAVVVYRFHLQREPASQPSGNPVDNAPPAEIVVDVSDTVAGDSPILWAQTVVEPPVVSSTPPRLYGVMGQGDGKSYGARIKAVHSLGKDLHPDELEALYAVLYDKGGLGMQRGQMHAFKNDIANILGAQSEYPKGLAAHLILMYCDTSQDEVWRDYCIQHLSGCLNRETDISERNAILNTLWKASGETGSSIAGTALISLSRNGDQEDADKAKVAARALELANDPQCNHLAKMTALQVCADLGEKRVLPVAREIADSSAGVPLRMSAIAAIGTVGEEADGAFLAKYATSSDVRLRKSAQSSISRLEAR